jgi:hypothetical protein
LLRAAVSREVKISCLAIQGSVIKEVVRGRRKCTSSGEDEHGDAD